MGSKKDHERIWLEPCACDAKAERTWCHHSTVYDPCEECGAPPTEYVRADLVWGDAAIRASYARGAREMRERCAREAYDCESAAPTYIWAACRGAIVAAIRALPDTPAPEAGEQS